MKTILSKFLTVVVIFGLAKPSAFSEDTNNNKQILDSHKAVDRDYRSFFSYPDTTIQIKIGTGVSNAITSKNHSIPQSPDELPTFNSGWGTSGDRPDNPSVHWRFLQRTKFGDVYLIDVNQNDTLVKAFALLYTGSRIVAYDSDGISVTIEPTPPLVK